MGERQRNLAVQGRGFPGGTHLVRQVADLEAGRRRRPLYQSGSHGLAREERHSRHDRCRPALNRRSLPAKEDRGRQARGHPRMHRMQHVCRHGKPAELPAVHAEPDSGRGVAPGMAPRSCTTEGVGRNASSSLARVRPASRRQGHWASAVTRSCLPKRARNREGVSHENAGCPDSPPGAVCATGA